MFNQSHNSQVSKCRQIRPKCGQLLSLTNVDYKAFHGICKSVLFMFALTWKSYFWYADTSSDYLGRSVKVKVTAAKRSHKLN